MAERGHRLRQHLRYQDRAEADQGTRRQAQGRSLHGDRVHQGVLRSLYWATEGSERLNRVLTPADSRGTRHHNAASPARPSINSITKILYATAQIYAVFLL